MRLAFYDDSTRSVMVLAESDENIDAMEELRRLVQETVRLELLVVQRHGSQIMRAPAFARRPNSGMLAAPDGSGKMQVCPTVESRLRLLQARLALAEHPTTLRTHVGADELQTQRKVMDHVIEQYTSRLTYARWLHDALSREDAAASAAESVASSEGVPFSISDGGGGGHGSGGGGNGGFDVGALLLKPLQGVMSNLLTRGNGPDTDKERATLSRNSSFSSTASATTTVSSLASGANGQNGKHGSRRQSLLERAFSSGSEIAAARGLATERRKKGLGVLVTELDVLVQPIRFMDIDFVFMGWYRLRISIYGGTSRNAQPAPLIARATRDASTAGIERENGLSPHAAVEGVFYPPEEGEVYEHVTEWYAAPLVGIYEPMLQSLLFRVRLKDTELSGQPPSAPTPPPSAASAPEQSTNNSNSSSPSGPPSEPASSSGGVESDLAAWPPVSSLVLRRV